MMAKQNTTGFDPVEDAIVEIGKGNFSYSDQMMKIEKMKAI